MHPQNSGWTGRRQTMCEASVDLAIERSVSSKKGFEQLLILNDDAGINNERDLVENNMQE